MEKYRINPELECINLTKEQQERLDRSEPVDIENLAKAAAKANIKFTFNGIDRNGIPHFKARKLK